MADTGNGATYTRTGFVADIIAITIGEQTIDLLDKSLLSTTGFAEKIAADLADAGACTIRYLFDSTSSDDSQTVGGAAVSTTFTFPSQGGTAATLVGTAILSGYKPPDFENNTLQEGSVTLTWDGVTGPTFTAEV